MVPEAATHVRTEFELLKKANIEARHSEHYTITTAQLDLLADCANRLQALVEIACNERLEVLTREATRDASPN